MKYLLTILIMLPVMAGDVRVTLKTKKERISTMDGRAQSYRTLVTVKHKFTARQEGYLQIWFVRKSKGIIYPAAVDKRTFTMAQKRMTSMWVQHHVYDDEQERYYGIIILVYARGGSLLAEIAKPPSLLKRLQAFKADKTE